MKIIRIQENVSSLIIFINLFLDLNESIEEINEKSTDFEIFLQ